MKKEIQENVNKARYSRAPHAPNVEASNDTDRSGPLYQRRTQWKRPEVQNAAVEVLKSTERPHLSAVVGESTPPSGLSGQIRRHAYQYSENEYRHWLPLLFADRVNVWEGLWQDLRSGTIPNIFKERGGKAAWKHDRPAKIRQVIIGGLLIGAGVAYLIRRYK